MSTKKQSVDIYQIVTDRIIEKMEAGVIPWKQPWLTGQTPLNFLTKKPYRGINQLLLGMSLHADPHFLTFKQAQQLGGHIKKGAKSEIVVFWQMRYFDERSRRWKNLGKQEQRPADAKVIPLLRYYRVFSILDTEGIEYTPSQPAVMDQQGDLDDVETGYLPLRAIPEINLVTNHTGACYLPSQDDIYMPTITKFHSTAGYFGVLYHELTHATGHTSRLAREGITKKVNKHSERYAKEELIAELGSCFLMHHQGFQQEALLENSAAYIQSWLQHLRTDKKLIIEAAAQAQKALDYILEQVTVYQPPVPVAA